MKLTLYCTPYFCAQWPKIKVILNNKEINTFEITEKTPSAIVNLELEEQNNLEINYYNKKEEHTTHQREYMRDNSNSGHTTGMEDSETATDETQGVHRQARTSSLPHG